MYDKAALSKDTHLIYHYSKRICFFYHFLGITLMKTTMWCPPVLFVLVDKQTAITAMTMFFDKPFGQQTGAPPCRLNGWDIPIWYLFFCFLKCTNQRIRYCNPKIYKPCKCQWYSHLVGNIPMTYLHGISMWHPQANPHFALLLGGSSNLVAG